MEWKKMYFVLTALTVLACTGQRRATRQASAWPSTKEAEYELSKNNVDATIYQHSSAEVYRLYQQCYELATIRLEQNLARPHDKPAAVIVDIDETVLDNSPFQMENIGQGITYKSRNWKLWSERAEAIALPGSVDFLRHAVDLKCEVYYITNRSAEEKASTVKNLVADGFPMVDDAHVMCMENEITDKTSRRKSVSDDYYVALLVGDQLRDFDERFKMRPTATSKSFVTALGDTIKSNGPDCDLCCDTLQTVNKLYGRPTVDALRDTLSQYFIMLPNPMYGTWLDAITGKVDSVKFYKKRFFFPIFVGH